MNPKISQARRASIVKRPDGATSMVQAAAIKTPEELAYAIRFLTDHFTYKRSKNDGVLNVSAGRDALKALAAAAETFSKDVLKDGAVDTTAISPLENGQIANPYSYVG